MMPACGFRLRTFVCTTALQADLKPTLCKTRDRRSIQYCSTSIAAVRSLQGKVVPLSILSFILSLSLSLLRCQQLDIRSLHASAFAR